VRTNKRLRGNSFDPKQTAQDRDTVERWARAEGVDLENGAERAMAKLRNVNGAQP
jgi:hypothetical protein